MLGGKGRGKQSRDTASEDALVARPGATYPLLAAREGAIDAQIDEPRQGLPHLTDPASLQDSRAGKQPEGAGTTEKGKQSDAQEKRTCTTSQATQTQPALLAELQALHHTHSEATRLFLMAASQGATDAQIADALRQGLPHLTDAASLQDSRAGKPPEGTGTGTTEKVKQPSAQKKRTRTTRQPTQTQPLLLAADAFAAALGAVPAEDWCRTWAACRTIMLRRTSKRVKEAVDKMRLPAVVRLSRSFWYDARNGTNRAKLEFVLRELAAMTRRCHITSLELPEWDMGGQDAERLAGVLAQCPALAHLALSGNSDFGAGGGERLAGVLGQCRELVHLNLSGTNIREVGGERLAGVLGQCRELVHLNLSRTNIRAAGAERLEGVLAQCPALAHLNLCGNWVGAESLAGILARCPALAHLDLSWNQIGPARTERLAEVLGQCPALAHLNVSWNRIGDAGAENLAKMLTQCAALAHLDLRFNQISTVGQGRLRAAWRGQASGLVL
jgi:hypothetical protein